MIKHGVIFLFPKKPVNICERTVWFFYPIFRLIRKVRVLNQIKKILSIFQLSRGKIILKKNN